MSKDTITFTHENVEYLVKKPSLNDNLKAQEMANKVFYSALKSGALLNVQLDDELKKRKLWDEEKEAEFNTLRKEIEETVEVLKRGGNLKKGRDAAIKLKKLRDKLRGLLMVRYSFGSYTAEGQSENAKFNCLASLCIVKADSKKPCFESYEDYLNRSNDEVAIKGANHLASLIHGIDDSFEDNLPENKFLKKFKFVDEKGRLVNKEGQLIDEDGKRINEEGQWINEEGKVVDKDGQVVEAEVVFGVFTDDEGNVVE